MFVGMKFPTVNFKFLTALVKTSGNTIEVVPKQILSSPSMAFSDFKQFTMPWGGSRCNFPVLEIAWA